MENENFDVHTYDRLCNSGVLKRYFESEGVKYELFLFEDERNLILYVYKDRKLTSFSQISKEGTDWNANRIKQHLNEIVWVNKNQTFGEAREEVLEYFINHPELKQ